MEQENKSIQQGNKNGEQESGNVEQESRSIQQGNKNGKQECKSMQQEKDRKSTRLNSSH